MKSAATGLVLLAALLGAPASGAAQGVGMAPADAIRDCTDRAERMNIEPQYRNNYVQECVEQLLTEGTDVRPPAGESPLGGRLGGTDVPPERFPGQPDTLPGDRSISR